ncbi:hypothetical protein H4Q26_009172 [Puccinia striiformis f. sp. tritici PST-130]|nr:hypothetical protein H4Q26_009172 [Puccinia striiformis f. sp. tritici PST-130]
MTNPSETSNPSTPNPHSSTSGNPDPTHNTSEPNTAKTNPTRKGRTTRAASKQQERTPTTTKSVDPNDSSQIAVRDIAAALGTETPSDEPTIKEVQPPTVQTEPTDDEVNLDRLRPTILTTIEPIEIKEGSGPIMPMKRRPTDGQPTEVRHLKYDIKMRTNAWQFKPTIDGVEYVSDFSEVQQDTYEEAYSEARANGELIFKTINPYAIGGPREKWEAATGTPPTRTTTVTQTPKVTAQSTLANSTSTSLPAKPNPGKQQPTSNPGYQGNNYNPNFRNRGGRGQGGGPRE